MEPSRIVVSADFIIENRDEIHLIIENKNTIFASVHPQRKQENPLFPFC